MSQVHFDAFFRAATGNRPYDYQRRLACGERNNCSEVEWLARSANCQSQLINIPTGLGKTAAVVLAWLWNRVGQPDVACRQTWPRRLVYCLPMRTLVEQTRSEVQKWVEAYDLDWNGKPQTRPGKIGVHILMGGEDAGEWDIHPDENAILIGTQDMLLSRALNRGYGMSRYRWPMHFSLLNNDCLWVMDETQLMGVGVETSAQLDGFRHNAKMPTFGVCPTWWMSATLTETRLATVDHPRPDLGWPVETLNEAEQSSGRAHELITAPKKISQAALDNGSAPLVLSAITKDDYAKQLAALIKNRHQTGTLTLAVVNRVSRARDVFRALVGGKQPMYEKEKVALIHSRFRPVDREGHTTLLFGTGDRIVIATQAVEAGVDVSARLLITELAPWSSLVQRLGRCNRRAEIPDAEALWVDIQAKDENDDLLLPYTGDELSAAKKAIAKLSNASPRALREIEVPDRAIIRPVIRRRDLMDLFDTTPDICGQDLDVSRYIRDGEDNDVQFFWRDLPGNGPSCDEKPPLRDELCRVGIGDAAKFFVKKARAWRWNPLSEQWEESKSVRPGALYLVDTKSGGYSETLGWTGDPKDRPKPCPPKAGELESYDADRLTFVGEWQTLADHTETVVDEAASISASVTLNDSLTTAIRAAALWHDIGKSHGAFQAMLRNGDASRANVLWAKSPNKHVRCSRHGFRHELASALAWLLSGPADAVERDLVAYLIAAHHGKVRLSIRSLPDETGDEKNPDKLFARGIWHGDNLPSVELGEFTTGEITLDLNFMRMGEGDHGPSWLARTLTLRDRPDLGPFRLAYLETLLRAADARASRKPVT